MNFPSTSTKGPEVGFSFASPTVVDATGASALAEVTNANMADDASKQVRKKGIMEIDLGNIAWE